MKKQSTLKQATSYLLCIPLALSMANVTQAQVVYSAPAETMKVSLFQTSSTGIQTLTDGNLTNYDDSFMDEVGDDALKMNNFGENFGIVRAGINLSVEQRRKINIYDTTYFVMWNMQQRQYQLRIINKNLNHLGLIGTFKDNYLNTSTNLLLNDTNYIDFTVNADPASAASNRFLIQYRNPLLAPLSSSFTFFAAEARNTGVQLTWSVSNETEIREFVLEHAVDAIHFTALATIPAGRSGATGTYLSNDAALRTGDQFYRIKKISTTGVAEYSTVVKVSLRNNLASNSVIIYPNPVENNLMNLLFPASTQGKYLVALVSSNGVVTKFPPIQIAPGQRLQKLILPASISPGIYQVKLVGPDNQVIVKSIQVLK